MSLENSNDWSDLIQEANTYSLFYEHLMLDATWNKKSFDVKTKKQLNAYANNPSTHCLLILRAPLITSKQYMELNKHEHITCITVNSLNATAELQWIQQALKQQQLNYTDQNIPKHIQTYTTGNLQAAHQAIERLALMHEPNATLTLESVQTQLLDESQYKLYEISSACLNGEPAKALPLLKRAQRDQVEPTLLLWLITQELRLLEQLAHGASYRDLNIYSFKTNLYQRASKRLSLAAIYQLIQISQALDVQIKSGLSKHTWLMTEQLVLAFSTQPN
jgi:DNA polymerase III subunit delta